jgi:hypothetical protein
MAVFLDVDGSRQLAEPWFEHFQPMHERPFPLLDVAGPAAQNRIPYGMLAAFVQRVHMIDMHRRLVERGWNDIAEPDPAIGTDIPLVTQHGMEKFRWRIVLPAGAVKDFQFFDVGTFPRQSRPMPFLDPLSMTGLAIMPFGIFVAAGINEFFDGKGFMTATALFGFAHYDPMRN